MASHHIPDIADFGRMSKRDFDLNMDHNHQHNYHGYHNYHGTTNYHDYHNYHHNYHHYHNYNLLDEPLQTQLCFGRFGDMDATGPDFVAVAAVVGD